jgi:5-deoxy-5-amino-3-dehydroquinate synthase
VRGSDRPLAQRENEFRRLYFQRQRVYSEVAAAVAEDADSVLLAALGIVMGSEPFSAGRAPALVADERVLELHPLDLTGPTHTVPAGEGAKSVTVVARLWSELTVGREGTIVGYGGGSTTDVAGFVAATYLRGVPWIAMPTTLTGQVDAAIGGKTGVNLPEGKNLVGAFWQPTAVLCDTDALGTLPERERRSGLGEMAKYHFLTGEDLSAQPLVPRIAACVRIKAAVVAADEREDLSAGTRGRAILNYGHTLAHALETAGRYDLRHGEAVAIGLVYAAELAAKLGRIDGARVDQHRRVVDAYGLPSFLPPGADPDDLVTLMRRDKKAVHGLTFVLDGPKGIEVVPGVDPGTARLVLDRIAGAA